MSQDLHDSHESIPPSHVGSTPAAGAAPTGSILITNGHSASPSNGSNVVSTPLRGGNAPHATQDSDCGSAPPSPDSSSSSQSDTLLHNTEAPRMAGSTFVSSLHFIPRQPESSEEAILQRAKEGGMKTVNGAPTIDGVGNSTTPGPWFAGTASPALWGNGLPSASPHSIRHTSREGQELLKPEALPFETHESDPASSPCIPTHISSPRYPPPRTRPRLFGLRECPTFRPTWKEFEDTAQYLKWVGSPNGGRGKEYGLVKIVPPEGWTRDVVLDQEKFRFTTRVQSLNFLSADIRGSQSFRWQLEQFHAQQGKAEFGVPTIDQRPLDIYRLKLLVKEGGGYETISSQKQWSHIARQLGYSNPSPAHFANQISTAYRKIIRPFEQYSAKQQAKTNAALSSAAMTPTGTSNQSSVALADSQRRSTETPGGPAGDLDLGRRAGGSADLASVDQASADGASALAKELLESDMSAEQIAELEAGFSHEGKRRSSRKRTQAPCHRSVLPLAGASPAKRRRRVKQPCSAEGHLCEVCLRGDKGKDMLLCDDCNRGYHMRCLDPPLKSIPRSDWYCASCLLGIGKGYAFGIGELHSLDSFWKRAYMFRRAWFEEQPNAIWSGQSAGIQGAAQAQDANPTLDAMAVDNDTPDQPDNGVVRPIAGTSLRVSEDDVEREFWRLVNDTQRTVQVEYGADIDYRAEVHSTTPGSAQSTRETRSPNDSSNGLWDLNDLATIRPSFLRYNKTRISGFTSPWLYVGMMFSTFCWHTEDHYAYSINYQYFGDTKTWYGVPGADAEKFEETIRKAAPDLFETSPDLLSDLDTLISPEKLVEEGVRVYACDQRANEFVVTFPKAYHSGFNHGYNLNEAVNYAPPDWNEFGLECVERYQKFCKSPLFSHDQLIVSASQCELDAGASWLREPMREMVEREKSGRAALRTLIPELAEQVKEHDEPGDQDFSCGHCKALAYLSRVHSPSSKHPACLDHTSEVCGADDCHGSSASTTN